MDIAPYTQAQHAQQLLQCLTLPHSRHGLGRPPPLSSTAVMMAHPSRPQTPTRTVITDQQGCLRSLAQADLALVPALVRANMAALAKLALYVTPMCC